MYPSKLATTSTDYSGTNGLQSKVVLHDINSLRLRGILPVRIGSEIHFCDIQSGRFYLRMGWWIIDYPPRAQRVVVGERLSVQAKDRNKG